MPATFGVVDLFAGPGGLGEGFASFRDMDGHAPFRIGISVEKEASAHRTLTLRAFLRRYRARYEEMPDEYIDFHAGMSPEPDWSEVDADAWQTATIEARVLELGCQDTVTEIATAAKKLRSTYDDTILIGGPPCQAYSLVGRARVKGNVSYTPKDDERHYLFRQYIRVLAKIRPAAFIMENVKGMLSSKVESRQVFEMLIEDLSSLGTRQRCHYELRAIRVEEGKASLLEAKQSSDFIVRTEEFGVPQKRHRVIIIGIRSDIANRASGVNRDVPEITRTVGDVIGRLPKLRSGISRGEDDAWAWRHEIVQAAKQLASLARKMKDQELHEQFRSVAERRELRMPTRRTASSLPKSYGTSNDELLRWIEQPELCAIAQHASRQHMKSDLVRYLFASVFGAVHGYSPKAAEFPCAISPRHLNWNTGVFDDRFRVQLKWLPSSTITSHISKDGHYFIHPDPLQCRSLTVREAARLQTFPDDYLFLGNRTQQYIQIGNAVPPYFAHHIAGLVYRVLAPG